MEHQETLKFLHLLKKQKEFDKNSIYLIATYSIFVFEK